MKRLLAIIMAAAVTGSGAFALDLGKSLEGLEITGDVYAGASFGTEYVPAEDEYQTQVWAYNDTYDGPFAARLVTRYTAEAGGLAIRIGSPGTDFYGYGWLNFLNEMIVLYGGLINGSGHLWGTTRGNILDTGSDALTGLRLAINPIEGLSLGVAIPVNGTQFGENNKTWSIGNVFGDMVIGVGYEMKDLFTAHLTVDLMPEYKSNNAAQQKSSVAFLLSATITPMTALAIDFDFLFRTEASSYNNAVMTTADAKLVGYKGFDSGIQATYTADPLTVWGRIKALSGEGTITLHDATVETTDSEFAMGLYLGVKYKVMPVFEPFVELGSHNLLYLDGNGLYAKIGFSVPLADGFTLLAYDKISGIGVDGDNKIKNLVQLSLDWTF